MRTEIPSADHPATYGDTQPADPITSVIRDRHRHRHRHEHRHRHKDRHRHRHKHRHKHKDKHKKKYVWTGATYANEKRKYFILPADKQTNASSPIEKKHCACICPCVCACITNDQYIVLLFIIMLCTVFSTSKGLVHHNTRELFP